MIGGVVEHFEKILPRSQAEISVVQQRLIRAGYRNEGTVKTVLWRQGSRSYLAAVARACNRRRKFQPLLCLCSCTGRRISRTGFLVGQADCQRGRRH